jgi:hypothetical protein
VVHDCKIIDFHTLRLESYHQIYRSLKEFYYGIGNTYILSVYHILFVEYPHAHLFLVRFGKLRMRKKSSFINFINCSAVKGGGEVFELFNYQLYTVVLESFKMYHKSKLIKKSSF